MKKDKAEANVNLEKSSENGKLADFRFIPVELTYPGYETFLYLFKRQLSRELLEMKDRFFDLGPEERKDQTFSQRLKMLSKLITNHPNIPGYPMEKSPEDAFAEFYHDDEETIQWIWRQYQAKLYPKEVIESISG